MTKTSKQAGIKRRAREAADSPQPIEHYKGYLIRTNPLQGYIWIECNGQKIASCASVQDARVQIDILTEGKV